MLEVEVKARVTEFSKIEERLKALDATFMKTEIQEDVYFAHPSRDFSKTDEALRVRRINERYFVTYKGPKIDRETKTREEIEAGSEKNIAEIFVKLGFTEWKAVRKERKTYRLSDLTICLDNVAGLGNFIEIESNDYNNKNRIFNLFEELGIPKKDFITKSYAEMLISNMNRI